MLKNIIVSNSYYDSATLMLLTNKIKEKLELTSSDIAIMMGTDMNKGILENSNLLTEEGKNANSGDLVVALKTDLGDAEVVKLIEEVLSSKKETKNDNKVEVTSVQDALENYEESNFAVVSLPGEYAFREVKKLLKADKHVLLFSDNVSIEQEIELKDLAIERNLLMMGPDCGTAIINGVGLGFSNKVKAGNIGIVAASGTGLQEVSTLISNRGGGISQAYGTGGRDIKDIVGGKMMLYCLDLLIKDDATKTIVIVAKPPEKKVLEILKEKLKFVDKPVVACLLGADENIFDGTNIHFAKTLEDAAYKALELNGAILENKCNCDKIKKLAEVAKGSKGYFRALYAGGTLAYEALLMLEDNGFNIYSNLAKKEEYKLNSKSSSRENTILDMGEDEFTLGKPHPMIDPTTRQERYLAEGLNPEVGILLADIELGYGSNDEAADLLAKDIKEILKKRDDITIISVICGSHEDYQGYAEKRELLEKAGSIVADSNAQAIKLAIQIMKGRD